VLPANQFHEIGAEAELAYRLGRDLPARAEPYSEEDVFDAITSIAVTIEIIDSRMRRWRDLTPYWQLADNQVNGALIVGDCCQHWQAINHSKQQAQLLVNGKQVVSAVASSSVGDPFNTMTAAVNSTVNRFGGLKAGDLYTAGSWTGTHFVPPGSIVLARFPGIGEAVVTIEK
jgi:2-keto-4-pentenoate hydratase